MLKEPRWGEDSSKALIITLFHVTQENLIFAFRKNFVCKNIYPCVLLLTDSRLRRRQSGNRHTER